MKVGNLKIVLNKSTQSRTHVETNLGLKLRDQRHPE